MTRPLEAFQAFYQRDLKQCSPFHSPPSVEQDKKWETAAGCHDHHYTGHIDSLVHESEGHYKDAKKRDYGNGEAKREYKLIRWENGLETLLVHDPGAKMAAAALDVRAGNFANILGFYNDIDDFELRKSQSRAAAHYLEHLFYFTWHRNGFDNFLQNRGFKDAFTMDQFTSYNFSIEPSEFQKAFKIFASPFSGSLNVSHDEEIQYLVEEYNSWKTDDSSVGSAIRFDISSGLWESFYQFPVSLTHAKAELARAALNVQEVAYQPHMMSLALISTHSIKEMTEMVKTSFSGMRSLESTSETKHQKLQIVQSKCNKIFTKPLERWLSPVARNAKEPSSHEYRAAFYQRVEHSNLVVIEFEASRKALKSLHLVSQELEGFGPHTLRAAIRGLQTHNERQWLEHDPDAVDTWISYGDWFGEKEFVTFEIILKMTTDGVKNCEKVFLAVFHYLQKIRDVDRATFQNMLKSANCIRTHRPESLVLPPNDDLAIIYAARLHGRTPVEQVVANDWASILNTDTKETPYPLRDALDNADWKTSSILIGVSSEYTVQDLLKHLQIKTTERKKNIFEVEYDIGSFPDTKLEKSTEMTHIVTPHEHHFAPPDINDSQDEHEVHSHGEKVLRFSRLNLNVLRITNPTDSRLQIICANFRLPSSELRYDVEDLLFPKILAQSINPLLREDIPRVQKFCYQSGLTSDSFGLRWSMRLNLAALRGSALKDFLKKTCGVLKDLLNPDKVDRRLESPFHTELQNVENSAREFLDQTDPRKVMDHLFQSLIYPDEFHATTQQEAVYKMQQCDIEKLIKIVKTRWHKRSLVLYFDGPMNQVELKTLVGEVFAPLKTCEPNVVIDPEPLNLHPTSPPSDGKFNGKLWKHYISEKSSKFSVFKLQFPGYDFREMPDRDKCIALLIMEKPVKRLLEDRLKEVSGAYNFTLKVDRGSGEMMDGLHRLQLRIETTQQSVGNIYQILKDIVMREVPHILDQETDQLLGERKALITKQIQKRFSMLSLEIHHASQYKENNEVITSADPDLQRMDRYIKYIEECKLTTKIMKEVVADLASSFNQQSSVLLMLDPPHISTQAELIKLERKFNQIPDVKPKVVEGLFTHFKNRLPTPHQLSDLQKAAFAWGLSKGEVGAIKDAVDSLDITAISTVHFAEIMHRIKLDKDSTGSIRKFLCITLFKPLLTLSEVKIRMQEHQAEEHQDKVHSQIDQLHRIESIWHKLQPTFSHDGTITFPHTRRPTVLNDAAQKEFAKLSQEVKEFSKEVQKRKAHDRKHMFGDIKARNFSIA